MKMIPLTVSLLSFGAIAAAATGVQAQTWTGAYVAASAGGAEVNRRHQALTFDTNEDGTFGDTVKTFTGDDYFSPGFCPGTAIGTRPDAGCHREHGKSQAGLRAGYDWQAGHWLYGGVLDVTTFRLRDSVSAFSIAPDSYTLSRELKTLAALRARVGWTAGKWLVYATTGLASADIHRAFTTTNAANAFTALHTKMSGGVQLGLGGEWMFAHNWTVGVEYLTTSLRDKGPTILAMPSANTFASNPFLLVDPQGTAIRRSDDKFEFNTVSLTLTYRFGTMSGAARRD